MRRTDHSLGLIAQEAGFTDQSHLTTVFRREIGVTPGIFRAEVAREPLAHLLGRSTTPQIYSTGSANIRNRARDNASTPKRLSRTADAAYRS
jgi:AraC-like DNA-binding protein